MEGIKEQRTQEIKADKKNRGLKDERTQKRDGQTQKRKNSTFTQQKRE